MKNKWLFLLSFSILFFASCGGNTENTDDELVEDVVNEALAEADEEALADAWIIFEEEDGAFAIQMPSEPEKTVQATPTEAGNIDLVMYMVDEGERVYMLMTSDLPSSIMAVSDPKEILKNGKDGALGTISTVNILDEKEVDIDGHPGIFVEVEGQTSGYDVYFQGVFYIVDNRLYQIYGMAQKGYVNKADIEKFLKTFTLL